MDTNLKLDDLTVLVVDDNQENLKVVSNILRSEGYKLALAMGGKEALAILDDIKVDLILLDIMMPEMNGYELCEIIKSKEEKKGIPIIFTSALNETDNILMGFEYGGVDYITKPFMEKELLARVKTHLYLKRSKELLEETLKARDKIHTIIAHDLRSPLGSIQMLLETMKTINMDEETFGDLLNSLSKSTSETSDLLENLLYWSKNQIGEINPTFAALNIKELVKKTIESIKTNLLQKNITINDNTDNNQYVFADEFMLRTILRNLLSNAIKFTSSGGSIDISSITENKQVKIIIKDTGVGMTEEIIKKIFEKDEYYTTKGTNKEHGTGLGLNIVKDFVKKNNGQISVKSKLGSGTTFSLTLQSDKNNG
jgi:two-component system sensor histidine kinase/response regulator